MPSGPPPPDGLSRPRLVVVEGLQLSTPLDPFLSLRALASYSCLSVRKLREYLDHPTHPLPHYRVGGKIVVRRSEFDVWVAHYRQVGDVAVDRIVADALKGL